MKSLAFLFAAFAVLSVVSSPEVAAQDRASGLFGERTLGRSLSRRSNPSLSNERDSRSSSSSTRSNRPSSAGGTDRPSFENVGEFIDEDARFVRGNREASDFVGSDLGETQRFVGAQQSEMAEEIRSAVDESIMTDVPEVNMQAQPAIPPRMLLNPPRLRVGFVVNPRPAEALSSQLTQQVASTLSLDGSSQIEVSVEGGVATLRGEMASEHDRKLASILVGFEPGVNRVRNEIRLAGGAGAAAAGPSSPASPAPPATPIPPPLPALSPSELQP